MQAGFNIQSGNIVYGIEADIQASGMRERFTNIGAIANVGAAIGDFGGNNKVNWFGSIRPRVGYLVQPSTLLYVTGGLGVAGGKYQLGGVDAPFLGDNFAISKSYSQLGWVAGAGLEHKFSPNWSAKLEYQYHNYGRQTRTAQLFDGFGVPTGTTVRTRQTTDFHTVRFGLNYHFVTGASAIVAKY